MENQQTQASAPVKSRAIILAFILLSAILIAATGAGIWYWQQQTVERLTQRNSELEQAIATQEAALQQAAEQRAQPAQSAVASYQADVGKFTLKLPNEYAIVVRNDGAGEGGPSTRLLIARATSTANVFTSSTRSHVTITATRLDLRGSFDDLVQLATRNGDYRQQSAITVDGAQAEVYTVLLLGEVKKVFFTHNGIFYEIVVSNTTETTEQTLQAIVDGFRFNR